VCLDALFQPVIHECGNMFCSKCLELYIESVDKCPLCRGPCGKDTLKGVIPRFVLSTLDEQKVKCPSCGTTKTARKSIKKHYETECTVPCPRECGEKMPRCQVKTHEASCRLFPVACEAADVGCKVILTREEIVAHVETCPHLAVLPELRSLHEQVSSSFLRYFLLTVPPCRLRLANVQIHCINKRSNFDSMTYHRSEAVKAVML
jgi:hypothetical protein